MEVSRSALRYVSTMPARDAELASELTQISARRTAYGYRFAWALLGRRGWRVNRKRVWRLLGAAAAAQEAPEDPDRQDPRVRADWTQSGLGLRLHA